MKKANIVELKNNFSKILMYVEKGERIQVCKRNIPIAYIVPFEEKKHENRTQLGIGKGTAKIIDDPTEPMIPQENWDMLKE